MFGFIRKAKRQRERREERREERSDDDDEKKMFPIIDRPTPVMDAIKKRMDKDDNPLERAGRRFGKK